MSTTTETRLTTETIQALRKANDFVVRHGTYCDYLPRRAGGEGTADCVQIECRISIEQYGKTHHLFHEIRLESLIEDFDKAGIEGPEYYGVATYLDNRAIRTIAALAKPGDILSLEWLRSNDNDNMREVRFSADSCRLVLTRAEKEFSAIVATWFGPSDSSVRMIRRRSV
jgi:hypothetical protein